MPPLPPSQQVQTKRNERRRKDKYAWHFLLADHHTRSRALAWGPCGWSGPHSNLTRLAWNHPKVVSHGKDSGDRVGADTGEVLVCLAVDNSLQSYMAVLDNDADWLLYAQGIFLQGRKSVDGAIQGQAQLVVHRRRRQDLDLVDHVLDSFDAFHDIFRV